MPTEKLTTLSRPGDLERALAGPEPAVVWFRHGRTAWNVQGRFLGRTDLELDEVGHLQAAALARYSGRFDVVYTSPLARARATAAPLAPPAPVADDALVEVDQGELEGLPVADGVARWPTFFAEWQRDAASVRIPGGETLSEARDRLLGALARWAPRPGTRVAAVSHQLAIGALLGELTDGTPATWRRHRLDHGAAVVLRLREGRWEVAARLAACETGP